MAIAVVQTSPEARTTSATSVTCTFSSNTTVGNHVLAVCAAGGTIASNSVSDNKSNSYSQDAVENTLGSKCALHMALIATGGSSHQVTLNPTGAGVFTTLVCLELSGVASASWQDGNAPDNGAAGATSHLVGTVTPTLATDSLFAMVSHGDNDRTININNTGTVGTWIQLFEQEDADAGQPINLVWITPGDTTGRDHSWNFNAANTIDRNAVMLAVKIATASVGIPPGLIRPVWRKVTRRVYR
jgi:hypothetical protein